MKVGYVRISSKEQNTARQDEVMKRLGVEKVYTDKLSGKNMDRLGLTNMLDFVREGDCVIVESISRLARNTKDLLEIIDKLKEKKVQFISQKEAIDTDNLTGKFMLTIFGAVSELERGYIKERQREGIDIAMEEGRFNGRPKKELCTFEEVYNNWINKNITASEASRQLNIARSTFYRRVKEIEGNKEVDF